MWKSRWRKRPELLCGAYVWTVPVLGLTGTPNAARLCEAEDLKASYERLYEEGAYGEAATLAERACTILEEEHGSESAELAGCIDDLGHYRQKHGAYQKAEPLLERALGIRKRALGPDHPDVATSLNNLASLYYRQGAYEKAEPLFERALGILEKALDPDHPDVAANLDNLAVLYHEQGAYRKAEPLHERALGILEKALGPDHPDVATILNNLASLYHEQGAYEKAEPLYERALGIWEKALGPDHPTVAISLDNLAVLYYQHGAYEKAEPLHERALGIREKALGPDHPDVAASLNNLASLYHEQGAYEKAEPLHERALGILEKALDPDHPTVAISLSNLASLYQAQGAYEKAEPLFVRALGIREKSLGPDHPDVAMSLHNLASLYYAQGNIDQGLDFHRRANNVEEINLVRTLTIADESRRLTYAWALSNFLGDALSLHLRVVPKHDAAAELALTTTLRRKNRVQDLIARSNEALRRSLPERERHVLDELADVDSRIAVLSSRGPGKLELDAFSRQIDELGKERDRLWSELAKHSALIESLEHSVTIQDVQRTIPNSGALVELVEYFPTHGDDGNILRRHEPKPPPRYAAYLVFPDHFDWVDLGPAGPIDEHVNAFRKALQTKQVTPTDLYDAVMRPIVGKVGTADYLVIAPAGDLSLIPFGALYDGKQYLIEKYDLRYVTTGRDLLAPPASPPVTTTPVTIVANPTGANLSDAELEADFLTSLFPQTRVLQGDQATETNIRTIERPLALHMATHGFFGEARGERDNPLFRSGLYLADIDQVEVDRERDDGQLTAYEVSGMDLRGTQLVVLSACETGLGAAVEAEGKELMSEGVSGLRRAFSMAGARTTVMSLWEVSGVTTQKTMEAYYRKLAEGLGRGEAMQAVQLEMLRSEDHAHPKDWAAFIVSGDDTPMVFPPGEEPQMEEEPQGPPPVLHPRGCTIASPSPNRAPSLPALLLSLLGLGTLRRRHERANRAPR